MPLRKCFQPHEWAGCMQLLTILWQPGDYNHTNTCKLKVKHFIANREVPTLTNRNYDILFTPFKIGNMELKRIVMSPMGTNSASPDGRKSVDEIDYFSPARGNVE